MRESKRALQMRREEMRRFGYQIVDTLLEHHEGLEGLPAARIGGRRALETALREAIPEKPADPEVVLRFVREQVFSNMAHVNHPRFFAFVPSPGNFVSAMADALASGFNPFVGTWLAGSGPAEVELVTIDWLRRICGMPEGTAGLFLSGGSMANLTALAVARQVRLGSEPVGRARIYYSDQTHSSVDRALRVLGFQEPQIRRLASDAEFRFRTDDLRAAVQADRDAGLMPFCVVANAGTTNTGAVDPLAELATFCRTQDLWLHVDGAYGAAAMLCDKGRSALAGLPLCDSLSLDPHKWLFQPFEIGCVLVREGRQLKETFRILPEYLKDAHRLEEETNFCDYGIQLTRNFKALKLWMSLKIFGAEAFREAIEWGFELAEFAEWRLRESGQWEIVSPAQMAIVAFRSEADPEKLAARLIEEGYAMLSTTKLKGKSALRFCTINPRTTKEDILETIERLERLNADERRV